MDANFLLPAIAALAVGSLASPRPSLSANLLFLQSILINIVLMKDQSLVIGTAVLLSFFAMVMIGANYYLEVPNQKSKISSSKVNIFIGAAFIFLFWQHIEKFTPEASSNEHLATFAPSTMEILVAGFTLFSILVSAILILDMRTKRDLP